MDSKKKKENVVNGKPSGDELVLRVEDASKTTEPFQIKSVAEKPKPVNERITIDEATRDAWNLQDAVHKRGYWLEKKRLDLQAEKDRRAFKERYTKLIWTLFLSSLGAVALLIYVARGTAEERSNGIHLLAGYVSGLGTVGAKKLLARRGGKRTKDP